MQHPEWPGERNPSQWDVHDAYWTPEVSFLQRFKAALLLNQDAVGHRQYLDREGLKDDATRTATDLSVSVCPCPTLTCCDRKQLSNS